jgi:hypothetical protein
VCAGYILLRNRETLVLKERPHSSMGQQKQTARTVQYYCQFGGTNPRPLLSGSDRISNDQNWAQSRLAAFGHGALTLRVRHQNIRHWRLRQSSGSSAN